MVLGCYYLTFERPGAKGEGKVFASQEAALAAYSAGAVALHSMIVVRMPESKLVLDAEEAGTRRIVTTVGKLIFNDIFPDDFPYVNSAEPARLAKS